MKGQREQMREYIASRLSATGEFSKVEQKYRFGGHSVLGAKADRNIYCEMDPQLVPSGQSGKYLVIVHSDGTMPMKCLRQKLRESSKQGIHTVHVLYRYINTRKDPSTHGPLFRRFVLDEERTVFGPGSHRAPVRQYSLMHYSSERRNNFRRTIRLERSFVPPISGHTLLYYQPQSARLPETMKRYKWGNVRFTDGELSEQVKEPILIEEFDSFTLCPMVRSASSSYLIGDMIGLADIEANGPYETSMRRKLGLLEHLISFGLTGAAKKMTQVVSEQISDLPDNSPLVLHLEGLMQEDRPEEVVQDTGVGVTDLDGKVATTRKIKVASGSDPTSNHFIAERINLRTGEASYTCSCESFTYRKRCGHIDELVESKDEVVGRASRSP
jgi:hypothetical protein